MPKPKDDKKVPAAPASTEGEGDDATSKPKRKQTSLKVDPEEGQLVGKVAKLRGLSVEDLFQCKDVKEFFTHLLLEEMRKETARLQGKKQS
jgi:hypothetical protein